MINALRGMRDLEGENAKIYQFVISTCSTIASNYGYEFIQTPILEETALFKRSVGESSDIVGKEMYQFTDKGGNDVCLRPEGTAGVVRSFIQNKYDRANAVKKYYYHGAMYRYERPQKGRFRQFHQFGVESFGTSHIKEDASVILMLAQILTALGIRAKLKLNSLGCKECMPKYRESLLSFLDGCEGLCEDCNRRKTTNPIRVLDCKNEHCQTLIENAPRITDNLCSTCSDDFESLKQILSGVGVDFEVDKSLVRGLDYYCKTAFEFVSYEIGSQGSIAGGGRYDRLVEFLDGKPTAGVGFAMGVDRLLELVKMPEIGRDGVYLAPLCKDAEDLIYQLSIKKRTESRVHVEYEAKSLKAHLKNADKQNALIFACIGEDELKNGVIWMKNLETKEEKAILLENF